ncbi:MAG: YecA family protein [Pseudomonadota bacterium]|uniref:YecA/YgfB family protein n=1 Tax=Alcanivorax sp. TaxID=1872427 RepID=UPI00243A71DE|nr:YecA family protein [Alcanivorax sp.]MED5239333.1 YecA family protein [Pseudomonadota bacterium]MEE3321984.1 YecA family protein [Pseudomonadota bacterium]
MSEITNPSLKNTVRSHFASQGEDAPTWTEIHGLLCALAVGPVRQVDYAELLEMDVPEDVATAMEKLRQRLTTQLLSGDPINLPCLLDPYQEDDGQDLASWCAGFMSGVFENEADWYGDDEEQTVDLMLPFILISGIDDDEALDELWQNTQVVRQMALSIPDLLEEFFLQFHGPDQGDEAE